MSKGDGASGTHDTFGDFARANQIYWDMVSRTADNVASLPEASARMSNVEIETTPSEVVYSENKLKLLHYEPLTDEQHDVPILVVYALINKPYILDIQPDRSVVRHLVENGFDVYLIDWGEPSQLDASLTLEDYVKRYLDNCVRAVEEESGTEPTLLGYCMGGTMSAMYAGLYPDRISNLALMASGLCFDGDGGVLELWGDEEHFDPDKLSEAYGNVPGDFLDAGFAMMEPVENTFSKYVRLFDRLDDHEYIENFARMEKWLADSPDVAGDTFAEFVEKIYQKNLLYENQLYLGDEHVDLDRIDMPVLQIVAGYDNLVPSDASKPFNDVVSSTDTEIIEYPTGHIGMSVSSESHEELWPQVSEWLRERSQEGEGDEADDTDEDTAGDIEDIDGIGPTYAERLREAGIGTVRDLRRTSVEEVAEVAQTSEKRVREWLEATE